MKLSEMQQTFCFNIAMLIVWAYGQGYKITLGESYNAAGIGHRVGSLHYVRLAQDLNLFKDGVYLTKSEEHKPLGEMWKTFNPLNRWGGDFKSRDGNHYSMEYEGRA